MEKDIAQRIVEATLHLYEAFGPLDSAISQLGSDDEKRRLAKAIGAILKISRDEILLPIFEEYPDLLPSSLTGKKML